MRHIDIYILLYILPKVMDVRKEDLLQAVKARYSVPVPDHAITGLETRPPSTKQLAHRLREMGFSVLYIAQLLEVKQPTVSYHLSTEPTEYVNPFWHKLVDLEAIKWEEVRNQSKY